MTATSVQEVSYFTNPGMSSFFTLCKNCGSKLRHHEEFHDTLCSRCKVELKVATRLEELSRLSLEQRVAKIEEWILRHEEGHALKEYIFS